MALVVEDGTGLDTAESYISVADADDYHSKHGNAAWAGDAAVKGAALRKATAYLDGRFRGKWKGTKGDADQALAWPRVGARDEDGYAIDDDAVPAAVERACAEAALLVITGTDLTPSLDRGTITQETNKVGDIEESKSYAGGGPERVRPTVIDDLLAGVTAAGTGGGMVFMDRA